MFEKFTLWFVHEISEWEHYFHLGCNCSEPIIILYLKYWESQLSNLGTFISEACLFSLVVYLCCKIVSCKLNYQFLTFFMCRPMAVGDFVWSDLVLLERWGRRRPVWWCRIASYGWCLGCNNPLVSSDLSLLYALHGTIWYRHTASGDEWWLVGFYVFYLVRKSRSPV
jgi:hypothetical protein